MYSVDVKKLLNK